MSEYHACLSVNCVLAGYHLYIFNRCICCKIDMSAVFSDIPRPHLQLIKSDVYSLIQLP